MRTLETVDRALQMLVAFDSTPGSELTVGELAARLGIHRSSASRLAATLAQRGFLQRAPHSEAFRLGPMIGRLGLLAIGERDLLSESREAMDQLARESGETVVLSVLEDREAVDIAQASGPHLVGVRNWIGRRSPLHASSDGKVFLAFADAPAPRRLAALTPQTITAAQALAQEIVRIRQRGWATVEGELEAGLNGVACPVFSGAAGCVAAISVSGPAYRLTPERLDEIGRRLSELTAQLSERLGHGSVSVPR